MFYLKKTLSRRPDSRKARSRLLAAVGSHGPLGERHEASGTPVLQGPKPVRRTPQMTGARTTSSLFSENFLRHKPLRPMDLLYPTPPAKKFWLDFAPFVGY